MLWAEILGFVTGAASVLLYVREKIWAWPLGIANSIFWLVLFWQADLHLDSGLQVVYIVLGILGWYWWLHGGAPGEQLPVTKTRLAEAIILACLAVTATVGLWWLEASISDSPLPFWDSLTTVVSLVAQYMLIRKLLGNWWLWISVDVAYVAMYMWQGLYLTAALQPLFIAMCVAGVFSWNRSLREGSNGPTVPVALDPGPGIAWGEATS